MKRSQINALIDDAVAFCGRMGFRLPPFAFWTPADWAARDGRYREIRDAMLGWDITDFGSGDFERLGLLLFTLRNGSRGLLQYPKPYAEKLLITREEQVTPYHFHWSKMEDIINRGGGNLLVQLYNAHPEDEGRFDDSDVLVSMDGCNEYLPPGSVVRVSPGQSITLHPRVYHQFWGERGTGTLLLGEVSMVNDDAADNRFHAPAGRFPAIEEDQPARYLLGNETPVL